MSVARTRRTILNQALDEDADLGDMWVIQQAASIPA
jgi:hypothetical protein